MSSSASSDVTTSWRPGFAKAWENSNVRARPGRIWPTGARAASAPSTRITTSPGENGTEPALTTVTENAAGRSVPITRRLGRTAAMAAFLTSPGRSKVRHTTGGRRGKRAKMRSTRFHSASSPQRQP